MLETKHTVVVTEWALAPANWFHAFCNSAQDSFENLTWLKEYSESMKEYHEWVKDKPYRKTKSTLSRPCPHKGYVAHILGAGIMLLNQNIEIVLNIEIVSWKNAQHTKMKNQP